MIMSKKSSLEKLAESVPKKRIKVLFEMLKNIKNFNIKMKYVKKAKKFNKVH